MTFHHSDASARLHFNADEVFAAFDSVIVRLSALAVREPTPQSVALLRSLIAEFERYDKAAGLAASLGLAVHVPAPGHLVS